jgi:hypothetical protein
MAESTRRTNVSASDWRVQVATVIVDGLIVLGVCVLLGLHVLDATIGVALLGPLIGARAAVHKSKAAAQGQEGSSAVAVGNAGGAVALVLGVGAALGMLARARGHIALLLLVLGIGATAYSVGRTVTGDHQLAAHAIALDTSR